MAGNWVMYFGSMTDPVPQPIIAKSIINPKELQSCKLVEVQLYAPEKFVCFLCQSVPPIHNQRPLGSAFKLRCIRCKISTSWGSSFPSLIKPERVRSQT